MEFPWTRILRDTAITTCQEMGSSNYDLVTNDEWQTLARHIEQVPSNWGDGKVGSNFGLNRGHSDEVPRQILAAEDDNDPCFGTQENRSL